MAFTDLANGFLYVILFLFAFLGWLKIGILYVIVFAAASLDALFAPAPLSIIPVVVRKHDIGRANSVLNSSDAVVRISGPGLGGLLASAIGPVSIFLLNACSFVISGASELFIREPRAPASRPRSKPLQDLIKGFHYFTRDKTLGGVCLIFGLLNFVETPLFLFPPIYAVQQYSQGPTGIGLTLIAVSLGGILFSSLLYIRKDFRRKGILMFLGTAICGGLTVLLTVVNSFWLLLILLTVIGVTFGININFMNIIIQIRTAPEYLGRVSSLFLLLCMAFVPIGYALCTWLLQSYSLDYLMTAAGIAIISVDLLFLTLPGFSKL